MSQISIENIYEELKVIEQKMITKEDLKSLVETIEILSNPETVERIKKSKEDIEFGRVKEVESVNVIIEEVED